MRSALLDCFCGREKLPEILELTVLIHSEKEVKPVLGAVLQANIEWRRDELIGSVTHKHHLTRDVVRNRDRLWRVPPYDQGLDISRYRPDVFLQIASVRMVCYDAGGDSHTIRKS